MAILRTTLSDIRTWQKKIVFPPRAPSVRSKSAISIPYKSNRRLLRDQTRRQTALSFPTSGLSGEAASNEVFKEAHKRFTYNREFPFHWNGNFKKYNKTSAGVLFPLYAPISPPFFVINLLNFSSSLAARSSEERRTIARVLNNLRHVTHVTWCCGTIVDLVRVILVIASFVRRSE